MTQRRDTSRKRASILQAAIQVFEEEGVDSASMDRIAERAGASKRTVYNHFPSKDALLQAVFTRFVEEHHALQQITYDPRRPLADQLAAFADAKLYLVNAPLRLALSRIMFSVFVRQPARTQVTREEIGVVENQLEQWLRAAAGDGRLNVPDPALAARIFYAMVEGALTYPALVEGCVESGAGDPLKRELIQTFLCRFQVTPA